MLLAHEGCRPYTMLISRDRTKLINAIIYFAQNTLHCGKTKLFKLLFLLDFEHFKDTGRSVTGLDYFAWELGPVPVAVDEELDQPKKDLAAAIELKPERVFRYARQKVNPKKDFDSSHFTKREIRLLEDLAKKYHRHDSKQMVNVTHEKDGPWDRVFDNGLGYNRKIPYELAVTGPDSEIIIEISREQAALRGHFTRTGHAR